MVSRTSTTLLAGLHDPRNDAAWRRFYRRYVPMLLSYAKRVGLSDADAQDAAAETISTFVQKYHDGQYDRDKARLKSWLSGIMQNKVRKIWGRRGTISLEGQGAEPQAADDLDRHFDREWQLERMSQALEILRQESDPNTYQAFDLYALKDWPVTKVASFLNITRNAVYISKTRMIQRLRQTVEHLEQDEE